MTKLNREFYSRDTLTVAKELLGKVLVHRTEGHILKGRIVETEAYLGLEDKGAHSYGGKKTKRLETMYGGAGRAYVYLIYGLYSCLNTVTQREGVPEGVLIRAIEPIENLHKMLEYRFNKKYEDLTSYEKNNISNGPGKLTMALNIDRRLDKEDLTGDRLYIETDGLENFKIIKTTRIGIDYAEEAVDYPYRFYIKDNPYVSKL